MNANLFDGMMLLCCRIEKKHFVRSIVGHFGGPSVLNVQLIQYHAHFINSSLPPEVYSRRSQLCATDRSLLDAVSKELFFSIIGVLSFIVNEPNDYFFHLIFLS